MTENATAIAEFWVQGEHLFYFIFLKVQYMLDNVYVETSDFKTAIQIPTSIRSGQESWTAYLSEAGKRSPHGGKKGRKRDCSRAALLCQSTLLLAGHQPGLALISVAKNQGDKIQSLTQHPDLAFTSF